MIQEGGERVDRLFGFKHRGQYSTEFLSFDEQIINTYFTALVLRNQGRFCFLGLLSAFELRRRDRRLVGLRFLGFDVRKRILLCLIRVGALFEVHWLLAWLSQGECFV